MAISRKHVAAIATAFSVALAGTAAPQALAEQSGSSVTAADQAQGSNVHYNEVLLHPGLTAFLMPLEAPESAKFELVDGGTVPASWIKSIEESTGKVTVLAPEDAPKEETLSVMVRVTFADGSTKEVPASVRVQIPHKAHDISANQGSDNSNTADTNKPSDDANATIKPKAPKISKVEDLSSLIKAEDEKSGVPWATIGVVLGSIVSLISLAVAGFSLFNNLGHLLPR